MNNVSEKDIALAKEKVVYNKKRKDKLLTIFLIVLIVLLVISNGIFITLAYFTDSKSTSSNTVITFGTVSIESKLYNVDNLVDPIPNIVLSTEEMNPGAVATRKLTIENKGNVDCFVRVYGRFSIDLGDDKYNNDLITFTTETDSNWVESSNKFYYKNVLKPGAENKITLTIKFNVSSNFGNSNADDSEVYNGKPYEAKIWVESCQSANTNIIENNVFDPTKWPAA